MSQKECIRLRQDYENIQEAYQNLANDRQSKQVASEGSKVSFRKVKALFPCWLVAFINQFIKFYGLYFAISSTHFCLRSLVQLKIHWKYNVHNHAQYVLCFVVSFAVDLFLVSVMQKDFTIGMNPRYIRYKINMKLDSSGKKWVDKSTILWPILNHAARRLKQLVVKTVFTPN